MKYLKRPLSFFLVLLILFSTTNVFAARHAKRDIALNGIIVNGHIVYSDVEPYIKNSRTYVPIRFIAEELGYDVKWDGVNRKVTMNDGSTSVELKIGSSDMLINGQVYKLDAPAEIKDDRTFVPLRAIAEAFGENVDFSEDYRAVYIGDEPKYNKFYQVVYYYNNSPAVISEYTINIATYKMNVNGNVTRYETISDLVNVVCDDFVQYEITGLSDFGVKSYKTNSNNVYQEPANKTNVAQDKQLKDEYYVAPTKDILVGTWYGPSSHKTSYGSLPTDRYAYIESMGGNKYKLTCRTILASDKSSEFFTEQYGYYDPSTGTLSVDKSHTTYGQTGIFTYSDPYSFAGNYYLENSNSRLSWGSSGSEYYFDKY